MIIGKASLDQYFDLFLKFVQYHKEKLYPKEFSKYLEFDLNDMKEILKKEIEEAKNRDDKLIIFLWDKDKMFGFLTASIEDYWAGGKISSLDSIYVDEGYRNKGYGKYLIEKFLEWAKSKGINKIRTYVAVDNRIMDHLLKKYGFLPYNIEYRYVE